MGPKMMDEHTRHVQRVAHARGCCPCSVHCAQAAAAGELRISTLDCIGFDCFVVDELTGAFQSRASHRHPGFYVGHLYVSNVCEMSIHFLVTLCEAPTFSLLLFCVLIFGVEPTNNWRACDCYQLYD